MRQYKKLLRLDPQDIKLQLEVADAHRRWGQIKEALETYERIAGHYMEEGFDARSVAVYKQILNLAPHSTTAYTNLAELYERMGLVGEALNSLQLAADALKQRGKRVEALGLLRRMAAMDPGNTTSRLKVANLLHQEGLEGEALTELEGLIGDLERKEDFEGAVAACRSALEIDANRASTCFALTRNLVAQRLFVEAVAPARHGLDLDPTVAEHYEVLLEVLRGAELDDELPAVYTSLAELHRRRGEEDKAREIMQRHTAPPSLDLSSEGLPELSPEAGTSLADADLPSIAEPRGLVRVSDEAQDANLDLPALREPRVERGGASIEVAASPAALPELDLEALIAQAGALVGLGKNAQAMECVEKVLAVEAEHLCALEKLGELHAATGENALAEEAWQRATKSAQLAGDEARFGALQARIRALGGKAGSGGGDALSHGPSELDAAQENIEIEIDLEGDVLEVESGGVPTHTPETPQEMAPVASGADSALSEALEEADFYFRQGLNDEAQAIYQRILASDPGQPTALSRLTEFATPHRKIGAESEATALSQLPQPGPPAVFPQDDPGPSLGPATAQGTPAEPILEPRELPGAEASTLESEGFDLAAELGDLLDDSLSEVVSQSGADDGFETVFDAFKKGVGEALAEGDHQAHYDLGIAYKEMGLFDDAVEEFRNAMSEPGRRLECLQLIGLCALDSGDAGAAVENLEALLGEPEVGADLALSARFDLGRSLVALGLPDRAREVFEAVADVDADFREVRAQLEDLPPPAVVSGTGPAEEDFENFEDLLAEEFGDMPEGDEEGKAPPAAPQAPRAKPFAASKPTRESPVAPSRSRKKKISFV